MKKVIKFAITIILILGIMFFEYRFIMCNICAYIDENNTVYLEIFEQVDEYDGNTWED